MSIANASDTAHEAIITYENIESGILLQYADFQPSGYLLFRQHTHTLGGHRFDVDTEAQKAVHK